MKKKYYWIIGIVIVIVVTLIIYSCLLIFSYNDAPARVVNQLTSKDAACYIVMQQKSDCKLVNTTTIIFYKNEKIPDFDANKDGVINSSDTFQALCEAYWGTEIGNQTACKELCGCP